VIRSLVVTLVAGAALAVPAAPSSAAECTGVIVVVDFASLGGGAQKGCAAGDPQSGVTALTGAGFEPSRAAQQPGYFVCRIDGKPVNDPCQRASPADAYWSYWQAEPGGTWRFSNLGAAERDPEPGDVDGWAFGAGDPPSQPPPAAPPRAEPTGGTATPQGSPTAAQQQPAGAPVVAVPSTAPRTSGSPQASPTASASAIQPTATPAQTASPTGSPSPEQVPLTADDPAPVDSKKPWVSVLLALAVIAGLGAAAVRQAQRRR